MSKGEPILTGVTIDAQAFGDPRFGCLADLLDLANQYEALGRMAMLWSTCTALGTDTPPRAKIVVCLGRGGPDALVESDLGELLEDGTIRVRGCGGRTGWYGEQGARGAAGGAARASSAPRGQRGRFSRRDQRDQRDQQVTSEPPASDQQVTSERSRATSNDQRPPDQEQDQDQELDPKPERERPKLSLVSDTEGWDPDWTEPALAASRASARARGVDVDAAVRACVEFGRTRGWGRRELGARLVAWLDRERTPSPRELAARAEAERAHRSKQAAQAARDRERVVLAPPAVPRNELWQAARDAALETGFHLPAEPEDDDRMKAYAQPLTPTRCP